MQLINGRWVYMLTNKHTISTLENIEHRYLKDGSPEIIFGLHEKGKPATLISPRPSGILRDDEMNRILVKYSPAVILAAIETGKRLVP